MTRIVAGLAKGRRLAVPAKGTRPTSDRAREALFSALTSRLGSLDDRIVVDLYAGSGALGLEALSRGAASVDLVESDRQAIQVLRENVKQVALPGAHIHHTPVERWLSPGRVVPAANVLLMDPPYAMTHEQVAIVLQQVVEVQALADGAIAVVERPYRAGPFEWPPSFEAELDRRYGEASLWLARFGSVTAC